MTYDTFYIADIIIKESHNAGIPVNNIRLQKLMYFTEANFYYIKNRPLIGDPFDKGTFTAWFYGPVIESLYKKYEYRGISDLPVKDTDYSFIKPEDLEIIRDTIKQLKDLSNRELIDISKHQDPWIKSYNPYVTSKIDNNKIREYFHKIY